MTNKELEQNHSRLVRQLAPECTVWLKRDGTFPLSAPEKTALYGNAARHTHKGGTGSGDVNVRHSVSIEEGLEAGGFVLSTKAWLDSYDEVYKQAKADFVAGIKQEAKEKKALAVMLGMGKVMPEPDYTLQMDGEGELGIYVLGRRSGEGSDRQVIPGDYQLTETEIRDIMLANETYPRFCLVLNIGAPVDLSPVLDVKNILLLSQLGAETGHVLCDLLLGRSYPSGKLTDTYAPYSSYPDALHFGSINNTAYEEGVFVGYRYFSSCREKVLFPFGFGLGCTDFTWTNHLVKQHHHFVDVYTTVKNIGGFLGKETIQVYFSAPNNATHHPRLALCGFAKTEELAPDERTVLHIEINLTDLAGYSRDGSVLFMEKGKYLLYIGNSSDNLSPLAELDCANEIHLKKVKARIDEPKLTIFAPKIQWEDEVFSLDIPTFEITEKDFESLSFPTSKPISQKATELAKQLTDKQLTALTVGSHKRGAGLSGVIGEASKSVAGAAGETFDAIEGLPSLVMADGPAGLRLSPTFWKNKRGAHQIGSVLPEDVAEFLPETALKLLHRLSKKKPKGKVFTQYCTSLPIGTAIAQSFSPQLAERLGDIVGQEMTLYGVDLWLAPAVNLHRTPLCGRNFEYLSEDPLLTGKMAAGLVRGVQQHPGRGVTIKHFCCNNQETNRYQSNSQVSVRALRELYLRPFEIVIREACPASLMTSYNLLCGKHTAEHKGLLEDVLRGEWGYDGVVMSDWIIGLMKSKKSRYRITKPAPAIRAGNDLFMPGCSRDLRQIRRALKRTGSRKLTRDRLEKSASRIISLALIKKDLQENCK